MSDEKLIISTAGSREEASRIAQSLVTEKFAACVNIVGPIESVFRWQDKVERAEEFLMLVKTTQERSNAAMSRIRELHSSEVPEAIEININEGLSAYLNWIGESVR
jgi:periplasmic divalent cation tolerance protein